MHKWIAALVIVLAWPALAGSAALTQQHRSGDLYFQLKNCSAPKEAGAFNPCGCQVSMTTVQLESGSPAARRINATLAPQEEPVEYCALPGGNGRDLMPSTRQALGDVPMYQALVQQSLAFANDEIIAVEELTYVYNGSKHGGSSLQSYVFNRATGEVVDEKTWLDLTQVDAINAWVQRQLNRQKKGTVFEDFVKAKGKTYLTAQGRCNGCALLLRDKGVELVFQENTVAPYSSGHIAIPIPAKYYGNAQLIKAFGRN